MEQDSAEINAKKWYNRWWGVVFLLILVFVVLSLGVFIYNFVYFVENGENQDVSFSLAKNVSIETADDPAIGSENPLITIVEFADFQCTYCRQEAPILRKIILDYNDEIKVIFRDFPISSSHPDAMGAALAANCAHEQDKFWDFHDVLFQNQDNLSIENLLIMARDLGLDMGRFSECLGDRKYEMEIQNDLLDGIKLGISGTPTFFINGFKVEGVITYASWVDLIEKYKSLIKSK